MYKYRISWFNDFTNRDDVECGFVAAASYGEAAQRLDQYYTGTQSRIYELQLSEVEQVLPDAEILEQLQASGELRELH